MSGRTVWRAKDSAWWRRERIVELGEEFGAEGPAVIDWLECEAKAQNDGGLVKAGVRSVSRGCFVDAVTVGHVLSRSVTLGLLDEFVEDSRTFTCRISGWQEDQDKAQATARKARQRARDDDADPAVEPNEPVGQTVTQRDMSRPVTECPPTRQDKTEQKKEPTALTASSASADRTLVFGEWLAITGRTAQTLLDGKRARLIDKALATYPVEDVLDAVRGWRQSPHHRGENDSGTVYNDLALLLRDAAHIERFRDFERNPPAAPRNGRHGPMSVAAILAAGETP